MEPLVIQADARHTQAVRFLPDGRLLSCGQDKVIRFWDLSSSLEVGRFEGHTKTSHGLSLSADGKRLLSAGSDETVRLWDVAKGKELACVVGDRARFAPDGSYVLHRKGHLYGGEDEARLPDVESKVCDLAFTPDGTLLVAGKDGLHPIRDGKEGPAWEGHTGWVVGVEAGHGHIVSIDTEEELLFWEDGEVLARHEVEGAFLRWHPKKALLAISAPGALQVVDAQGELVELIPVPVSGVYGTDWSPDGRRLALAAADGKIRIYDMA